MIDEATQERIKTLLREFMDSWIAKQYEELRRIEEEGFSPSGVLAPFHDALVPGIRGLGERGFSTALGNLHERIALVIGECAHAEARRAFDLTGQLPVLASRIAEFYETKLQRSLERIVGVVGPLAIVLISIVVGGLIVSVMTSLLSVSQVVG